VEQDVNIPTYRLLFMAGHTPGERLKRLRERLGWSLRDAAKAAETVSYSTLRNLEQRVGSWEGVSLGTLVAVGRAYGVSIDRLIAYVLEDEDAPDVATEVLRKIEALEVHPDWIAFPVYAAADAGDISAALPREDDVSFIPKEHLMRRDALREHVRVFKVDGGCVVSDEVRRNDKSYSPGDYVAVDVSGLPQVGDVVAAWWNERELMVIKRFGVDREQVVLHPLSGSRATIVLPDAGATRLVGSVIWRGG
jgi:transcriptional regulator with XRE-family HTH domain